MTPASSRALPFTKEAVTGAGVALDAATRGLTNRSHYVRVTAADLTRATGLQILIREGERYRLNSHHLEVDLWALHTGVEHAAIAHDPTVRTAALATIIRLYTGELAAGQPWPWLDPFREATRRHVIDAYAALAEAADPSTAIGLLEAALRIDPVNEDLHHRAARAYAAAGQPARASALLTDDTSRLARAGEQPNPRR